ncbi:MAG: hypothetical protein IPN71_21680 [Fibrobacteres bacterium]|nr:hypothetical protein [Fibrobacterota bacterium]
MSKVDSDNLRRMEALLSQESRSPRTNPERSKSSLLKRLLERLDAKTYRTVLIPWAGPKTGQILREICDKIRLDVAGRTPYSSNGSTRQWHDQRCAVHGGRCHRRSAQPAARGRSMSCSLSPPTTRAQPLASIVWLDIRC